MARNTMAGTTTTYARAPKIESRFESAVGAWPAMVERPQDGQNTLISGISVAQCEQIILGLKDNTGLRAFVQIRGRLLTRVSAALDQWRMNLLKAESPFRLNCHSWNPGLQSDSSTWHIMSKRLPHPASRAYA